MQGEARVRHLSLADAKTNCPICGSAGGHPYLLSIQLSGAATPWLNYHRCDRCHSLLSERCSKGPEDSGELRSLTEELALRGSIEFFCAFDTQSYGLRALAGPTPRRVLDVGCGIGIGADFAQKFLGAEALGVDPSGDSAKAAEALGFSLINDIFEPADPRLGGPFDVIQAWELIEHLEAPLSLLQGFRSCLTDEGVLFLSTPNGALIDEEADEALVLRLLAPPEHLQLFSASALEQMLRRAGFAFVEVTAEGGQLLACASAQAPQRRDPQDAQKLYLDYLTQRCESPPDSPLFARGFRARRLMLALGTGDWGEVEAGVKRSQEDLAANWGIDLEPDPASWRALLSDPPSPEDLRRLPFTLTLLLFCKARLAQRAQDWALSRSLFKEAQAAGETTSALLGRLGLYDSETAFLAEKAERFPKTFPA
jgi:2-polyprenyl-3-methyl-5-hydroxy-6-metoxy-1,4-benzoquinol methylase